MKAGTGVRKPGIPLLPTLLVAAAALTMIALGIWQLRRAETKEALLARYAAVETMAAMVTWPRDEAGREASLYRRSQVACERVLERRMTAGRNAADEPGWAQVARCALDGGGEAEVVLGWSLAPQPVPWAGGVAEGIVAPAGRHGARLVADPPLAGLIANAAPDPGDLPNNHLAYAVQWFFFAATAVTIYAIALRKRLAGR